MRARDGGRVKRGCFNTLPFRAAHGKRADASPTMRILRNTAHSSVTDRAAKYLSALPPSVAGQRGHDDAFRAACALVHGFALPESVSLGLLLAHFNPTCSPPWSEADLRHKVRSAAGTTSTRGRGYLLRDNEPLPAPNRYSQAGTPVARS